MGWSSHSISILFVFVGYFNIYIPTPLISDIFNYVQNHLILVALISKHKKATLKDHTG